jgi:hypothetical protein
MRSKTQAEKPAEQQTALELIDDRQRRFVELLLSGKSIAEAARQLQIGRRTATYWMEANTPVRFVYERERQKAAAEFRERLMRLHDLALKVIEETLEEGTDPALRVNVAKFIYSTNLAQYSAITPLADAESLVQDVVGKASMNALLGKFTAELDLIEDD